MAWAPNYCTAEELAAFVRVHDDLDAVQMGLAVAAASRAVDAATGRQFGRIDAPQVRAYMARREYARRRWVVSIDDLMTDEDLLVTVDGVDVPAGLVSLRPLNADVEGRPWEDFVVPERVIADGADVQVSARWGWAAVPDAVHQATLLQASRFLARRDSPYGVAGSPEQGGELRLLARVDPDVEVALRPYVRRRPNSGAVFA